MLQCSALAKQQSAGAFHCQSCETIDFRCLFPHANAPWDNIDDVFFVVTVERACGACPSYIYVYIISDCTELPTVENFPAARETSDQTHNALLQIGTPVMRDVVFGDIGINTEVISPDPCGGGVPAAGALVLTFLLNNYQDADYQRLAEQWEKEVGL